MDGFLAHLGRPPVVAGVHDDLLNDVTGVAGIDRMNYYLFIDPSKTTVWGDGTGGTSTVTRTIVKTSPLNIPIFGRVPARQNLRAGAYGDNLVVPVNW
jgi:spore coat protein U-like protein